MPRIRAKTVFSRSLDQLETREVPATFVGATTLTYQDIDGDDVKVVFSKPILTTGNVDTIFTFAGGPVSGNATKQQLQSINLNGLTAAAGTTISTTATRNTAHGGDGFAALGQIVATGVDLGAVKLDGDLGRVVAGDATTATTGMAGLTVQSFGRYGLTTGATDLNSVVKGKLGLLSVKTDVRDVFLDVQGGKDGQIGSLAVLGSLIGGDAPNEGRIQSGGSMGAVTIGGSVTGGDGSNSGSIYAVTTMGAVTIGGSVVGGGDGGSGVVNSDNSMGAVKIGGSVTGGIGTSSGSVYSLNGSMGAVTVAGSVTGGGGSYSGRIYVGTNSGAITVGGSVTGGSLDASGNIDVGGNSGAITVGGSVVGGSGVSSGYVAVGGNAGAVTVKGSVIGGTADGTGYVDLGGFSPAITIGGDVVGGNATGTANLSYSGFLEAKRLPMLTVGGSVFAGANTTTGTYFLNGSIEAEEEIGTLLIKGSIVGNATNPFEIFAKGKAGATTTDLAIGKITVNQNVEYARIRAGYGFNLNEDAVLPLNADAQIGAVSVLGDWVASSVVAGAVPTDAFFGNGDDAKASGAGVKDTATVSSKIASLTIGGQVLGTAGSSDFYGVVAENIGTVKVGGTTIPTLAGNGNDDFSLGITGDVKINEI